VTITVEPNKVTQGEEPQLACSRELAHRATEEAVQDTTQRFSAEIDQMRQIVQALRDKQDAERIDHNRSMQTAIQQFQAENGELQRTVQAPRDALERQNTRTKSK
jgi:hypothetical protein